MNMPNNDEYSDGENDFDDDEYSEVELNRCEIFYRFEMKEIIEPALKYLKKYYKNDPKVFDIYISNSKIYILTEYKKEFIFSMFYSYKCSKII